jgi:hypothetical protein
MTTQPRHAGVRHSRAPLVFAALSTERTSAGSRWVIVGLDCLRVLGAAGIWFSFEMQHYVQKLSAG